MKFIASIALILFSLNPFIITSQNLHSNISGSEKTARFIFPEWAKGVVWYQIFPERFSNGDSSNDPEAEKVFINDDSIPSGWKVSEWTSNWFSQSDWEVKLGGNFRDHLYERRYGGDIQGIINKLDYLKELGVGAIYLNPVFEAASLHKYDGSTFHHIDVNFGPNPWFDRKIIANEIAEDPSTWKITTADSLFFVLISEVHKRDMKIIIDGVFNHTGRQFWAFQDIVLNGSGSKYKDWFSVISFDDPLTVENEFDYKGWWGIKSLPEFNRSETDLNEGPKKYIFNATRKWMDPNADGDPLDGIDGWRLDVAREVPIGFWNDWSAFVKNINQHALIVGELWELSPDFVSKDGPFDALMNYEFAFAVNDFFIADENAIPVSEFVKRLENIKTTYPVENLLGLQNLMDSHDTDRLSSMIKNPGRKFDRDANEGNKNYDPGKPDSIHYEIQRLILAFQMTYQGSPMIYYGDEVGMWGADDPHCRKPMIWNELVYDTEIIDESSGFKKGFGNYSVESNKDLLSFYKKLILIRNSSQALRKGKVEFIFIDDEQKTFAFQRSFDEQKYLVVFNLSYDISNISLATEKFKVYSELISREIKSFQEKDSTLNMKIPQRTFRIFELIR